jgi:3-hydroxyisobutyrate dehydrogenase-like beta-hydroxyacid dehydrogenase
MRVGFIGLGSQGGPMASRILAAGFETTLWARREAALDPYRGSGAHIARTRAELGASCHLVCVCVVDDAGVEDVLCGGDGVLSGMRVGGIVAVHSTVHPDTIDRLARAAAERGVALVDAPVSGGGEAAAAGALAVIVGADDASHARCLPVFSSYGNPVIRTGAPGSAQLAKLVNNVLFTSYFALVEDALRLGSALGIDPEALGAVLRHGSSKSLVSDTWTQPARREGLARFGGALLRKDVGIVARVAAERGADSGALVAAADRSLALLGVPR